MPGTQLPILRTWIPIFLEIVLLFVPDESRVPKLPLPAPENNLFQDMTPLLCTGTHFALCKDLPYNHGSQFI